MWGDLAIGTGACGLGCRACFFGCLPIRLKEIPGEFSVGPKDETGFGGVVVEVGDHAVERFPAYGSRTCTGFVFVNLGEGMAMLLAPGAELAFLLRDGLILAGTTKICFFCCTI